MVVCKYFQNGFCRYGQNCRFEHVYGSKYSYHANAPAQAAPQPQAPGGMTDEQLVQTMQTDVKSLLNGGQWILSGYGPIKEKPNFPGITDLSPEEARLFIYEAKSNNTIDQAVAYMNNRTKEARSNYEQLLQPTPSAIKVLRSLYKGETTSSPFTGQTLQNVFGAQSQTNASSLFRSANQSVQSPPFAQQEFGGNKAQSIFAQANNANVSLFTQQQPQSQNAQSIFAQASQNVFGAQPTQNQSFFGATDTAKSVFAQANTIPDITSQPAKQPYKSPFEQQSPFAQATNMSQATNVFQQTPADDPSVYSNMNDVSPEDLEMFKSNSFKLGFIPEIPPPHSLCV